jgi:tripartite ATP-independent transporter DctM subunit
MTLLIIVLFLVLLLLGMDVGFAMVLAAVAGIMTRPDAFSDAVMLPLTMLTSVDSAALLSIPLFILAGELMNSGGVTQRLIHWSLAFVGHFRGALSQVAVVTNLIMAGISGSAVADATATGTALIPAMKRAGYHEGYAGAVIAAASMLGPIIPPSITMVVYAVMANHSVIKIFLGGVIPGFMLAAGYMVICAWIARRRNYPAQEKFTWPQRWQATRDSGWALAMPVIVLAGIRFGIVTDIEALFVGWVIYRELDRGRFVRAILDSGRSSAVILFLLAAAGPFGWLLSEAKVNQGIRDLLLSISTDPLIVLVMINIFLLLIGKILEPLPAMIIFVPTLLPVAAQLNIDPTHFAIIVVLNLMIGLQTPPVGLLLFVSAAVGKEPIGAIILQIIPFVLWSLTVLALIVIFPPLATWLPGL